MKPYTFYSYAFLVLTLFLFPALQSCAQPPENYLTHADRMIQQKKYKSAFALLDSLDPANENPDYVIKKTDIVLNYYVATVMHQMFALEDLQKDQKAEDLRKIQGDFQMKTFVVHEILDSLIQKNPQRYDLHNTLTEFYYEVLKEYPEGWIMKRDEILKRIEYHGQLAIKNKTASATTHYIIGFLYAQKEEYNQAFTHYAIALHIDPEYAAAYYNIALIQMYKKEFLAALPAAQAAVEYYTDSAGKAEASRLAGYVCEELSDDKEAYKYFLQAWNLDKKNLDNIHALTEICVRLKKNEYKQYTEVYFETDPENEAVYGGLIEIYAQYGMADELIAFFEEQLPKYAKDPKVMANLYYFSAGLIHKDDKQKAIKYLKEAKSQFLKFLPSKHLVILTINEKLEELSR